MICEDFGLNLIDAVPRCWLAKGTVEVNAGGVPFFLTLGALDSSRIHFTIHSTFDTTYLVHSSKACALVYKLF
jgi:hypothetical protein